MRLEADLELLTGTAADLREAVEVARQVAHHRSSLTELLAQCGSARLRQAASDFLEQWGHGMGLVVDDAERLAEVLETSARAYAGAEEAIARGLR